MKIIITFFLAIFLFSNAVAEVSPHMKKLVKLKADKIIMPNDPVAPAKVMAPRLPARPPAPRRDIVGERFQAGDTWYDYQSNGSIGKMIAVGEDGGVHIIWMDGEGAELGPSNRNMKYGYAVDDEFAEEDGTRVNNGQRGGYGHIALTTEDEPRGLAFYHAQGDDDVFAGMVGVDFLPGLGAFLETPLPQYPDDNVYWPQGVMTTEGRIHVVYNREDAGMVSYALGGLDRNGNPEFGEFPEQVAETHLNTYRIAASPNSERVAITWVTSRVGIPAPDNWAGFLAYQMNNDIYMVVSEDGDEWDFDNPINVTNTLMPDIDLPGEASRGDVYLPYCTHDVIFDANDNIHVVFDTREMLIQADEVDTPPVDRLTVDYSYLFIWSEETEEITPVADGFFSQAYFDDDGEFIRAPAPGAWKSNVCAPSLTYAENGDLYCVFNYYPYDDNSDEGYCNGEIYVTVSEDNGATWYVPTNITETRTHLADFGEHACELYPTVAEKVDDFLHISYLFDTQPGTTIQGGAASSLGFWYYHKVPVDEVAREEIWEDGPSFHRAQNPLVMDPRRDQATPVPDQTVEITADVQGQAGEIAIVELEWVIDGDLDNKSTSEMENAEGDSYVASIPGAENGSYVWYRIVAVDENEGTTVEPDGWWYSYVVRPEGELMIRDVQYRPADWNTDYSPYKDYEVTITGVVTTPEAYADVYGGYAIQEAEEDWSGLYIRGIEDIEGINSLDIGDQVTVTGMVKERDEDDVQKWRYQTYIDVTAAEVIGQEEPMNPIEVELDDLRYATRAEDLEGVLVTVTDVELGMFSNNNVEERYRPLIDPDTEDEAWLSLHGMYLDLMEEDFFPPLSEWTQGTAFGRITGVFSENQRYGISVREFDDMGQVDAPEIEMPIPSILALNAAFPNPFNSTTKVSFQLPTTGLAKLALYDLSGRMVRELVNGRSAIGSHEISIVAADLSTGIYLLRLDASGESRSLKLVLIK